MLSTSHKYNPVMGWQEWSTYDASGLAELVRSKQVTPLELLSLSALAVIKLNPRLEAVLEIFEDVVDQPDIIVPNREGKFYGVPFFLKDISAKMKGRLHEQGTRLFKGCVARETDPLIENFLQAGLIILGRSTVPEMGFAFDTSTTYLGKTVITRNPWNLAFTAGGSSGGAAVIVSSGITQISMSSDGAGSTRVPAAFTGLIGLKTTRGRVPTPIGVNEYTNPSSAAGVLTRTVRDWATVLDYLIRIPNGNSFMKVLPSAESYSELIKYFPGKLRIALSTGLWGCLDPTDPQIIARTRETARLLQDLGHIIEEIDDEAICDFSLAQKSSRTNWIRSAGEIQFIAEEMKIPQGELHKYLEPMTHQHVLASDQLDKFDLWRTAQANPIITRAFGRFFDAYDVLLTPTCAIRVPTAGGPYSLINPDDSIDIWLDRVFSAARYTYPANECGLPAISLPAGIDGAGLPIGVQLYANFLREDLLLQLAAQLEQAKPEWFNQMPPYHVSKI